MTMNRLFYLATSLIISLTPLTVNAGEAEFRQLQTKVEA